MVIAMVACSAAAKTGGLLLAVIAILFVMAIPALSVVTRTVSTEMKPDRNDPRMDRNGLLNVGSLQNFPPPPPPPTNKAEPVD